MGKVPMDLWLAVRSWRGSIQVADRVDHDSGGWTREVGRWEEADLAVLPNSEAPRWSGPAICQFTGDGRGVNSDGKVVTTYTHTGSAPAEVTARYPGWPTPDPVIQLTLHTPPTQGTATAGGTTVATDYGPTQAGTYWLQPLPVPDRNGEYTLTGALRPWANTLPGFTRSLNGRYDLIADLHAVRTLEVWLNVFIPGDVKTSRDVPAGKYLGKRMIAGPPGSGWFLTDSRSFSARQVASSRLHLLITVDLPTGEVDHDAVPGLTVELDEEGKILGEGRTSTDRVKVGPGKRSDDGLEINLPFDVAVSDPLVALAAVFGDVDAKGKVTITIAKTWDAVTVKLDSKVDDYPAFEAYARLTEDGRVGRARKIAALAPPEGALPYHLAGDVRPWSRTLAGEVTLKPPP